MVLLLLLLTVYCFYHHCWSFFSFLFVLLLFFYQVLRLSNEPTPPTFSGHCYFFSPISLSRLFYSVVADSGFVSPMHLHTLDRLATRPSWPRSAIIAIGQGNNAIVSARRSRRRTGGHASGIPRLQCIWCYQVFYCPFSVIIFSLLSSLCCLFSNFVKLLWFLRTFSSFHFPVTSSSW